MKLIRVHIILIVATLLSLQLFAQQPLHIVNGRVCNDIDTIPQSQIARIEMIDLSDEVIAKYGNAASNGVSLITLKWETPARLKGEESLTDYITNRIEWDETDPVARFAIRYTISSEGKMLLGEELESTERRFRRKILKILDQMPEWHPATNLGEAVAMDGVLSIQLPIGRDMPIEKYIVLY